MRQSVSFRSRGLECRGWLYRPPRAPEGGAVPGVVMAHGFSAVKEMHLPRFAERFARAGLAVLVFDFRFLGESEGEPRGQVLPEEQLEDYRNALSWLARQPGVDRERLGVWGTSYSGGHVLRLAAFDPRVRAAVAQVPALNVWRQLLASNGREGLRRMLELLMADRERRFDGGEVASLPVVAPPGEPCVLASPDAYEWFRAQGETLAPTWRNAVTLESVERMVEYDPADAIELIAPTPLLVILAERDALIPLEVARAELDRAGEPKQVLTLPCAHFDVYATEPYHGQAASAATEWFVKHLGAAASGGGSQEGRR